MRPQELRERVGTLAANIGRWSLPPAARGEARSRNLERTIIYGNDHLVQ